ncbi:2-amino-4-hydroxy-6-hydroxymethyldihydropteridine diphosphokinase [Staphylococcus carnosus]|uniref:2-amino-4-hydroxy-6-hydroxymethyldihydropteridine diphosphokinase n=1 Tax=Staphylococcus carnosus (strain TM300) TaxID=396513 RepID=B9DLC5_STACT|nr:2-amino-4-hydroxy-6-hydroxymethyldihydropteridine diphosphokinase [Staphylococcus carnosus]QPT03272.1 2-amino-4-hydroxy-6-hydroxymethyldihydropteridine diphosphokinase [Staphylococcus carnosus]UQA68275.1 2-amino-4-hydroxy-6-hydroxymethyldihydropteridine diphosphokinase [Staphylococcus carnosus]UTB79165.1 2-amino-4-hydroxy-6-hydroxymethyldihydropteridine diphosphokinase [Staphylococcus carnosus]UTB88719.1 2-amino-4-hydroxy-6-hydroxymethyldihydropteridine diphosphokinase [Staphylococcus carnos
MTKVYLGLGSNVGDREHQLKEALRLLDAQQSIKVTRVSSLYETAPVGYVDQPDFLNLCAEIETDLTPQAVLKNGLDIEQQLHRVRKERWGPRTLDIDILLYGNKIIEDQDLSIPHPRMAERAFVLIPLQEIAPEAINPRTQTKIKDIEVPDETVNKYHKR